MKTLAAAGFAFLAFSGSPCARAEPALYETGPAQDASFVRFLNATPENATVRSATGAAVPLVNAGAARV